MAYRFSLATVLRIREGIEKREELTLQRTLAEIARAKDEIADLALQIIRSHAEREVAMQHLTLAHDLQGMLNDADAVKARREALIVSVGALEQQLQIQMRTYEAAHQDRQMLTDMESRKRGAYDVEIARNEQKTLDDIFAARSRLRN